MKCLARPIKTIETKEFPRCWDGEQKKTITIKTEFSECSGHECPYYYTKISYAMNENGGKYIEKAACRMVNENG